MLPNFNFNVTINRYGKHEHLRSYQLLWGSFSHDITSKTDNPGMAKAQQSLCQLKMTLHFFYLKDFTLRKSQLDHMLTDFL